MNRDILNDKFKKRWIGRGGSLAQYPARSPDLTICDYFLWGYLRERVYSHSIHDINELEQKIHQEIQSILIDMFQNSVDNFARHCDECINSNGGYIE